MPPNLLAATALMSVLVPVGPAELATVPASSCSQLRDALTERAIQFAEAGPTLVGLPVHFLGRASMFSYKCADDELKAGVMATRPPNESQAVEYFRHLNGAIAAELGRPSEVGQQGVKFECLLQEAGLARHGTINATWRTSTTTIFAAIFKPPPESHEWRVGFLVRLNTGDPCGESFVQ